MVPPRFDAAAALARVAAGTFSVRVPGALSAIVAAVVLIAAAAIASFMQTAGSIAGLLLGVFAARVLAFVVYEATPRDPIVLAGVVLVMAALGLAATWLPARRALSIDPLRLLRED